MNDSENGKTLYKRLNSQQNKEKEELSNKNNNLNNSFDKKTINQNQIDFHILGYDDEDDLDRDDDDLIGEDSEDKKRESILNN